MCKTMYRVSNQVRNSRCFSLNELYFTSVSAYHCTSLLMSRDVERLRKNPLNINKATKSYVSRYKPTLRDDTSIPKLTKTQNRQSQGTPTRTSSVTERKVSSELQKLRFEDFDESETAIFGVYKNTEENKGEQLEIVFGVAPCLLALMQGRRKPSRLFVKDDKGPQRDAILKVCQEGLKRGVQIQRVNKKTLDKMCGGKVHQGLCLLAGSLSFVTEERPITYHQEKNQETLWLVLDGIQDPMNLGAILRSAYFLGVDRVVSSIHNRWTPNISCISLSDHLQFYSCICYTRLIVTHNFFNP